MSVAKLAPDSMLGASALMTTPGAQAPGVVLPPIRAVRERPQLGFGLGLRNEHFQDVLEQSPKVDWFEILSENFMVAGGKPRHYLRAIRERYPMVMHGVSLSIGSMDPLDQNYLRALKQLIGEVEPAWVSDHLCWTSIGGHNSHDLLPLPFTAEALNHVVARVQQVQEFLGREILLENASTYLEFTGAEWPEWEFLAELARRSGCRILLDVNNIYVSARNHGFDTDTYLAAIPADKVWQIHLAGHSDYGSYVIDTHDHPVCDQVWALYQRALARLGPVSTMIERDDNIPSLAELVAELDLARATAAEALGNWQPAARALRA